MTRSAKIALAVPVSIICLGALVLAVLPKGPKDPMEWDDPIHQTRDMLEVRNHAVVAGTPWAAEAGLAVLESGGNAYDAAVSALLVLNVTFGEAAGFPGVAPVMIYSADEDRYRSYIGAGTAPAAASIRTFTDDGKETIPDFDIRSQLIPASPDVLIRLLADYGTMSFAEVAAPAITIAREGFPVHSIMAKNLDFSLVERIGFSIIMPSTAEYYLRGEWWRPVNYKDRFTRPELADTWERMAAEESRARANGGTRLDGLQAVRDFFYEGDIADSIIAFHKEEGGWFRTEDLAGYEGDWEEPYTAEMGPYRIHTNAGWSQGIVVPLTLGILFSLDEETSLREMGHNSPEYIHTVLQAIELAMADREAHVADPAFFDVPAEELLSPSYWAQRAGVTGPEAFGEMPPPGVPDNAASAVAGGQADSLLALATGTPRRFGPLADFTIGRDTSQVVVVDGDGNAVAITPSDFPKSPMLPEWGLNLGNRMVQFRLDPEHPASLVPGKRPRITPHAVIVEKDGAPFLVFNTPGGDMQTQALVQVFLNRTVFDMDIQEAIEAPRFRSYNFPDSFSPHEYRPGRISLESSLYEDHGEILETLGYSVENGGVQDNSFSAVGAIEYVAGGLNAGSDPREATTALGR